MLSPGRRTTRSWSNCPQRIRQDVALGFAAEPYSAAVRERALHQHPRLAAAVVDADPEGAAEAAAEHFSLTETTYRSLYARTGPDAPDPPGGRDAQVVPPTAHLALMTD